MKRNPIFEAVYTSLEPISYDDDIITLLDNEDVDLDDHAALVDIRGRRILLYSTILGTLLLIEDKTLSETSYYILYDEESPLTHILPFREVTDRDLLYICGDEENDVPNLLSRTSDLVSTLDYFDTPF